MEKTKGSVMYEENGNKNEVALFTYSEAEKQENEINRENAKIVFCPEFIPYYVEIQKEFNLSPTETLLYGFLRFYLSGEVKKRFYFTNDQIGKILNVSAGTAANCIKKLKDLSMINPKYKMKAGGGQVRFINSNEVQLHQTMKFNFTKRLSSTSLNDEGNKNTIKENKIKKNLLLHNKQATPERYGNEDINWLLSEFERLMQFKSSGSKDRIFANHLIKNFSREQLTCMILYCSQEEYAPRIGSMEKLWYKRGDIIAGLRAMKNKQSNKIAFIS